MVCSKLLTMENLLETEGNFEDPLRSMFKWLKSLTNRRFWRAGKIDAHSNRLHFGRMYG